MTDKTFANSNSLSSYFSKTDPVTLDNCDKEQIHLSGAIQSLGVLLVVHPETQQIIAASANAADVLNIKKGSIFSLTLSEISSELASEIAGLANNAVEVLHEVLDFELNAKDIRYDTVTHFHDERRIIEFLPNNNASAQSVRRKMRFCSNTCSRVLQADSFNEAMQLAVDAIRDITDFSRVKVYRFLPDWSGETVSESRDATLESYLGLHFPASDIPQQVRQVMLMVPYRAIGATTDDIVPISVAESKDKPVDLTWSLLRSVSTMHTQYSRNMGVHATFSCSLLHKGKLWGLIACHNSESQLLPFDMWGLIHEIGAALMLRYDQKQRTDVSDMIYQLRLIENQFASQIRRNGDVEDVIEKLIPTLQQFLDADGFAFQYGANLHLSGMTPPADFVQNLLVWATSKRKSNDQFLTNELHKHWEPARAHIDTACGVLIQPITVHRVCQLIWFRGPTSQRVHWAGKPESKQKLDKFGELQALQPRSSFERWIHEHSEQSTPWQDSQLESAREIFKEFLDIIASQILLKEENASLRIFTASAAHDIRAPLRGISMALEAMDEDNFETSVVRETHAIAQKSAIRLTDLTETLLDLAVITEQEHKLEPTDLNALTKTVTELLDKDITDSNALVDIATLPTIVANNALMTRLFLNLISNAIKYKKPDVDPIINISSTMTCENTIVIEVTDNGMGIPLEKANAVFKPLQRLHSAENIEGSGLGLTICKKVVDVHHGDIYLDTDYSNGARFIIKLPVST